MLYIVGASSLKKTIGRIPSSDKKLFRKSKQTFAVGGLSFNKRAKNSHQILQNLLSRGRLSRENSIVIWHDIINNSITRHPVHNTKPCPIDELLSILLYFKPRIEAIIYSQRNGTRNIREALLSTGILIIDSKKHLLSVRQRRKHIILRDVAETHPSYPLEIQFLERLWNSEGKLSNVVKKKRSKKNRKGQKQRKRQQKHRHK